MILEIQNLRALVIGTTQNSDYLEIVPNNFHQDFSNGA